MTTLIFPFYVERTDDMQGVYGRQVARILAETLQENGVKTKRIQWFAPKNDARSHVCIEAPLPRNIIDEEAAAHGAERVLLGRVRVAPEETMLKIVEHQPHGDDEPIPRVKELGAIHALPHMVERAAQTLLSVYTDGSAHPAPADISDTEAPNAAAHFESWRDALLARDAQELTS